VILYVCINIFKGIIRLNSIIGSHSMLNSQDMMMQQNLNMGIFNVLRTGNPVVDAIILSIVGAIVANYLTKIISVISSMSMTNVWIL
jgi:hypothetical protein